MLVIHCGKQGMLLDGELNGDNNSITSSFRLSPGPCQTLRPQSLGPPDPCVPWTSGPVTLDFLGLTLYWGTTKGEVRLETATGTVELV